MLSVAVKSWLWGVASILALGACAGLVRFDMDKQYGPVVIVNATLVVVAMVVSAVAVGVAYVATMPLDAED